MSKNNAPRWVVCDDCGRIGPRRGTSWEAREMARSIGWVCNKRRDVCTDCQEKG